MTDPDPTPTTDYLPVFEHIKRRDWGLGILAWEKQSTRGYLFENGQLRVMAEEFYSLMREVDRPHDEVFDAVGIQVVQKLSITHVAVARMRGLAQHLVV